MALFFIAYQMDKTEIKKKRTVTSSFFNPQRR